MGKVMLEVRNLKTKYVTRFHEDVYAVDGVSFKIEEGKSLGIAGESGCGKSTLALSMMGYYFPFSMEANYNTTMYITNKPCTMCHELSHLKGFIYEDEANFIGYLACIDSDDPLFQYSGYLSILSYVDRDFYKSIGRDRAKYKTYPQISRQVKKDDIFLTSEAWSRVNSHAWINTKCVKTASDAAVNTSLKTNGVKNGIASYSMVVQRLMDYYDGTLW